jgi:hypothetical protein
MTDKLVPNGEPARSAQPGREVQRGPVSTGLDLATFRKDVLELAGVTPQELAELLREGIEQLRAAMHATKSTPLVWEGELRGVHEQPDHPTIVRAVRALVEIFGLDASPRSIPPQVVHQEISIDLSGWCSDGRERVVTVIPCEATQQG